MRLYGLHGPRDLPFESLGTANVAWTLAGKPSCTAMVTLGGALGLRYMLQAG